MNRELVTAPEGFVAIEMMVDRLNALWNPPPHVLPSEYARTNLWLTQGARKGFCNPDPYQIEIMDAVARGGVKKITFLKPVQIGYTTILQSIFLWATALYAHQVLIVQPTQPMAKKFAKERIDTLIEHSPVLAPLLIRPGKSSAGSTIRDKQFSNGASLFVAAAKADRELRMFSSSMICLDERSIFEVAVGSQGDPGLIAAARGEVFEDLVIFQGSTPVLSRGRDPIEQDYLESSMGRWNVPCPQCNGLSTLPWKDENGKHRLLYDLDNHRKVVKGSVRYACIHCGGEITEKWKVPMADAGQWIHARPEITDHLGYHTTSIMSVQKNNWDELAQQWVDAQGNNERLKTFITLRLAETWLEPGSELKASSLSSRLDPALLRRQVPDGAGVLIAFVDVQKSWVEGCIWAFGVGAQAWLVDWFRADGDTSRPEVFEDLDAWLLDPLHHANGKVMPLDLALIDSGYNSGTVYNFVLPRQNSQRRTYASKGSEKITAIGLAREGNTRKARVRLFNIATDPAKKQALGMLQHTRPGPGYVHLPSWVSEEFIKGLASERHEEIVDPKTGLTKQKWTKIEDRNEPWDCFTGAVAGLWILQNLLQPGKYRDLEARVTEASESKAKPETKADAPPAPRFGGTGLGGGLSGGLGGGLRRGGL